MCSAIIVRNVPGHRSYKGDRSKRKDERGRGRGGRRSKERRGEGTESLKRAMVTFSMVFLG